MEDFENLVLPDLPALIAAAKRKEEIPEYTGTYTVTVFEAEDGKIYVTDNYAIPENTVVERNTWEDAIAFGQQFIQPPPIPVTPLSEGDIAKWGITDLYDAAREKLQELLDSGKDFDTGFGCSRKELDSMRITGIKDELTVEVSVWMDDLPDLIYDACPDGQEERLTEKLHAELEECLWECIDTETTVSRTLPRSATIDEILEAAEECRSECDAFLQENFECCKTTVVYALEHSEDAPDASEGSSVV